MKNIFYILILLFISDLQAQNDYTPKDFLEESPKFFFNVGNWETKDVLIFGSVSMATIGLIQFDNQVREAILQNKITDKTVLTEFGKAWGEPLVTLPISTGFYIHGLIAEDKTSKRIGFEIFQSFIYTGIVTTILKSSIGRARPYMNLSSKNFKPFTIKNDFNSLPSGHTSVAFSLSTILSNNVKNDYLKVAAYLPAFATAFSRMSYDKHWLSDVFLGAALGYFIGNFVHNLHEENLLGFETTLSQPNVISFRINL